MTLNLPDNIQVTCRDFDNSIFSYQPGRLLNGWAQDFRTIYNSGVQPSIENSSLPPKMVRSLIEPDVGVTIAFFFNDVLNKYDQPIQEDAFTELKLYFYDNFSPELKANLNFNASNITMIMVPRFVENFGILTTDNFYHDDVVEEIKRYMCRVSYISNPVRALPAPAPVARMVTRSMGKKGGVKSLKQKKRRHVSIKRKKSSTKRKMKRTYYRR